MAGSEGYRFVYFSVAFYLFLGFILSLGAGDWLSAEVEQATFTPGTYSGNYTTVSVSAGDYVSYIWQNPFSGIGFLAWLSLAILITNIYIIITSLIP